TNPQLARGFKFNNDGTRLFVTGADSDPQIHQYALALKLTYDENNTSNLIDIDANDGNGGGTDISITYSLTGEDASLLNVDTFGRISFNNSPNFEVPLDQNGDNQYDLILVVDNGFNTIEKPIKVNVLDIDDLPEVMNFQEYYSVASARFDEEVEEFSINSHGFSPENLTFSSDGSTLFFLSSDRNKVFAYGLDRPFDLSHDLTFVGELLISSYESLPVDLSFSNDGNRLFILGDADDSIIEYELSSPFDLSTASYSGILQELLIRDQESLPTAFTFDNEGLHLYLIGNSRKSIIEYDLSFPFDVSSASYLGIQKELPISDFIRNPTGIEFNFDGSKLFVLDELSDEIVEFNLNVKFDLSSANYSG
ncbi:MAG: hypothetical protein AAFN93_28840, partial [Bacteroidota bacterium]